MGEGACGGGGEEPPGWRGEGGVLLPARHCPPATAAAIDGGAARVWGGFLGGGWCVWAGGENGGFAEMHPDWDSPNCFMAAIEIASQIIFIKIKILLYFSHDLTKLPSSISSLEINHLEARRIGLGLSVPDPSGAPVLLSARATYPSSRHRLPSDAALSLSACVAYPVATSPLHACAFCVLRQRGLPRVSQRRVSAASLEPRRASPDAWLGSQRHSLGRTAAPLHVGVSPSRIYLQE